MARINLACVEIVEALPTFEPILKMVQANNGLSKCMKPRKKSLSERSFGCKCASKRRAERRDQRNAEIKAILEEERQVQSEEFEG